MEQKPSRVDLVVALLAVAHVLLHLLTHPSYGMFRDEFYYLACAARPAWGYVDHPPLSVFLLGLNTRILGDSVLALRLLPALAGGLTVFLTGLIARELGGGRFAQGLAALCVAFAPIFCIVFDFYSMNAFEILFWTLATWLLVLLVNREQEWLWLVLGMVLGLGLLNKHTTVVFGLALGVGLLLSPARRYLARPWFWGGALLAGLILLPNLIWQAGHGWPSLEFYRNADLYKNIGTPWWLVLLMQAFVQNPATLPVIVLGIVFYLASPSGRSYRFLGWTFVGLLSLMVVTGSSRPDRIAGAYPMVFAGGAVFLERFVDRTGWRWIQITAVAPILVLALLLAPLGLSAVPPQLTTRYMGMMAGLVQIEQGNTAELPQWLADRMGWEEMVVKVVGVYESLSAEEKAKAVIFAGNYGEAGALEYFGKELDLPPVVSAHNSYHLWGLGGAEGEVVIAIGASFQVLEELFDSVEVADVTRCIFCMDYENNLPIYVARHPRVRVADFWEELKRYL